MQTVSWYSFILIKFWNILFASSCINYDRMDAKWQNASFIMFSFPDNRAQINLQNKKERKLNLIKWFWPRIDCWDFWLAECLQSCKMCCKRYCKLAKFWDTIKVWWSFENDGQHEKLNTFKVHITLHFNSDY